MYANVFQGDQFEEDQEEPNAFDLFKLCHYSKKKKGYTPNVQMAIVRLLSNDGVSNVYFRLSLMIANFVCSLFGRIKWRTVCRHLQQKMNNPSPRLRW